MEGTKKVKLATGKQNEQKRVFGQPMAAVMPAGSVEAARVCSIDIQNEQFSLQKVENSFFSFCTNKNKFLLDAVEIMVKRLFSLLGS